MANHAATKKSIRKVARISERNRARKSRVKTFLKSLETAIESTDKAAAQAALRSFESEIMTAAAKGVYKKTTSARKVSRMVAKVKAIGAKKTA